MRPKDKDLMKMEIRDWVLEVIDIQTPAPDRVLLIIVKDSDRTREVYTLARDVVEDEDCPNRWASIPSHTMGFQDGRIFITSLDNLNYYQGVIPDRVILDPDVRVILDRASEVFNLIVRSKR